MKPIKTSEDYRKALARLEVIFDAKPSTHEGIELQLLCMHIANYEEIHFPIAFPDPVEALKFRMDQFCVEPK